MGTTSRLEIVPEGEMGFVRPTIVSKIAYSVARGFQSSSLELAGTTDHRRTENLVQIEILTSVFEAEDLTRDANHARINAIDPLSRRLFMAGEFRMGLG